MTRPCDPRWRPEDLLRNDEELRKIIERISKSQLGIANFILKRPDTVVFGESVEFGPVNQNEADNDIQPPKTISYLKPTSSGDVGE